MRSAAGETLRRNLTSLSALTSSRPLPRPHLASYSSASAAPAGNGTSTGSGKKPSFGRRAVPIVLLSLTGGVALSAINDLAIFHGCSIKAIEKASHNQQIVEALGEPIVRGPWYDASLAVGHRRHSVSCTFPVSGPQGSGIFRLKAIRPGEDGWFSFLRHHDWDILTMDALLHVPTKDEESRTVRINIMDGVLRPSTGVECMDCKAVETETPNDCVGFRVIGYTYSPMCACVEAGILLVRVACVDTDRIMLGFYQNCYDGGWLWVLREGPYIYIYNIVGLVSISELKLLWIMLRAER